MHRRKFENFLYIDRKILYITLGIVLISIFSLTIIYAALSTTLNINGNAEVTAASWDIYLDNVQLNSNSATTNVPTITDKTTATFSTTLSKPGDYYMFTVDVVNSGTIDAMIDSVTKTPELTDTQKKYLNYIVEYQNGESIATKQLVSKNSFVRLLVKVEFRKDLTASDLPTTSETLNLSFKVNYVQSDDSSENITIDDNGKLVKVMSGNFDTIGSEICIDSECFYVISSDENTVTMLAKYNLYAGGVYNGSNWTAYGEEATGLQNATMRGHASSQSQSNGTIAFSTANYWSTNQELYSEYVYDLNSNLYLPIENYKNYLRNLGVNIIEARLISIEELETLNCLRSTYKCSDENEWLYSTSYWTGSSYGTSDAVWRVISIGGELGAVMYYHKDTFGIRPVIKISKN